MNVTAELNRSLSARFALLFMCVLVGSTIEVHAANPEHARPDPAVRDCLRHAANADRTALLVGSDRTVHGVPGREVSLPLAAFAIAREGVELRDISVSGPDQKVRGSVRVGRRLRPVGAPDASADDLLDRLASTEPADARSLLARGLVSDVRVRVDDLGMRDGTTTTFTATATFEIDGVPTTAALPLAVTVATLPAAPSWSMGDGHVHSSDWSDGWRSLSSQVSDAQASGHRWIVMTDHWKGIWAVAGRGNENWRLYQRDCSSTEAAYRIPVLPGAELMAVSNQGHALAYALDDSKIPPRDAYFAPGVLTATISAHAPDASYAVIGHPFSATADRWGDWSAPGIRAIELMSQERQSDTRTQAKWFELLRSGTGDRLAGRAFVVGVANSDSHLPWQLPGDTGATWIRSTTSPLTRAAVWDAIRSGAASASGRGDLGYFAVNGIQQGGVAVVSSTTPLIFNIAQRAVTGRKCTEVSIRNSNNVAVWSVANPAAAAITKSLPAPAADTFYVVKMVFAKTNSHRLLARLVQSSLRRPEVGPSMSDPSATVGT